MSDKAKQAINPYVDGRKEWLERYGDYIEAAQSWRRIAIITGLTALLAVCGVIYIGSQNKIVPYVVQVSELGQTLVIGRADRASPVDPRVVRFTLANWITNVRSVYKDNVAQRAFIDEAYSVINFQGDAYTQLNTYFRENDPFRGAAGESATVQIESVLPISDNTWRVEWRESVQQNGETLSITSMQGTITVQISAPTDDQEVLKNPLGIYINFFNWTARL